MVYIGYIMLLLEVLQLLCENKIDFVMKRYGQKILDTYKKTRSGNDGFTDEQIPIVVLKGIKRYVDPSEKYLEWIAKQYVAGLYIESEDDVQVKEDLELFEKYKRKMQYQDINRYNLRTLRQELKRFDASGNEGDFGAEIQKAIENKDIRLVERCEGFVIYHALTKEGAILLGKGGDHKFNKWCTARTDDENKFDFYNTQKNCDIYVAIFDNGKRFQFDIDRFEHLVQNCMDELDSDMLGGEESPDSDYWPIIRKSDLIQSEYRKSMEHHWAFNSSMVTWKQFVEDSVKQDKRIMPSLSSVLQSVGFMDYDDLTMGEDFVMIDTFTDAVDSMLMLSDVKFLEDMETLGVLYKRKYNDTFNRIVDEEVVGNRKVTDRVYKAVKQSGYDINEFNDFVEHLFAIGNGHHAFKGVK